MTVLNDFPYYHICMLDYAFFTLQQTRPTLGQLFFASLSKFRYPLIHPSFYRIHPSPAPDPYHRHNTALPLTHITIQLQRRCRIFMYRPVMWWNWYEGVAKFWKQYIDAQTTYRVYLYNEYVMNITYALLYSGDPMPVQTSYSNLDSQ